MPKSEKDLEEDLALLEMRVQGLEAVLLAAASKLEQEIDANYPPYVVKVPSNAKWRQRELAPVQAIHEQLSEAPQLKKQNRLKQ